jgi:hypothetical protein
MRQPGKILCVGKRLGGGIRLGPCVSSQKQAEAKHRPYYRRNNASKSLHPVPPHHKILFRETIKTPLILLL